MKVIKAFLMSEHNIKYISDNKIRTTEDLPVLLENFTLENISNFLNKNKNFLNKTFTNKQTTLLFLSISLGINEIAEFLLSLKANPDLQNDLGETPLFQAVENSNHKIINLLLEAGANPNLQNQVNIFIIKYFFLGG